MRFSQSSYTHIFFRNGIYEVVFTFKKNRIYFAFQMGVPYSRAVSKDQTMWPWRFLLVPLLKTCQWTSVLTCAQRKWVCRCLSYLQYCVYRSSYIISSFVCHRNSLWQPWLVKNVTVDFLLHSSPCMSVRMKNCVSSTVPEKTLRTVETMTSL